MGSAATGKRFDVIVVGSGVGGLTAALTAARRGRSVLVLEAGKQFGGYLNPFKRRAYTFDPGLHYIGECGPGQQLTRIFEALGLSAAVRFRELSPDGFDRLAFPGYEVAMPKGLERYKERLERDFPHERAGLARFFDILSRFREAIGAMTRIRGAASLLRAAPHAPLLLRYGRSTFAELLNPIIRDPMLRAVLAAQGGDYGLPPSRAHALIGLGILDHYLGGAYFPVGGSRAMRDALVHGIQESGGELLRNHTVERIEVSGGRAAGVRCAGGEAFDAGAVISNVDAIVTYRDLIGTSLLPSGLRRKVERARHSLSSLCLFVGTDIDLPAVGMTDANIWHYPTVDIDSCYAPLQRGEMPRGDLFFLSSPSLKDPESPDHAPPGHHTLELVTLVPFEPFARWEGTKTKKRGDEYEAFKTELADRYLASAERYVPGLRGRVTQLDVATPVTNITYAASPRGAIYGLEHTVSQMGPWRFGVKGAFPGLFLCGSSVFSAGVVPSAVSGFAAGKAATALA